MTVESVRSDAHAVIDRAVGAPILRRGCIGAILLLLVLPGCGGGGGGSGTIITATPVPNPPQITCPAATTVQSTDDGATVVEYAPPVVTDGAAPVATSCTPPGGSRFGVGQTSVTCTATDAQQRAATCTFSVKVLPVPQLVATRFVAFGDSITWGEDGDDSPSSRSDGGLQAGIQRVRVPLAATYPEVLRQLCTQRYTKQTPTVWNAGQPGEVAGEPTTLARFVHYSSSGQYDVALLMDGSNDVSFRDALMLAPALDSLGEMIRDAKSRGMRVLIATVPPQDSSGFRGRGAALVPDLNAGIRSLAAGENVPLVDVQAALAPDLAGNIGWDGVHPTVQGYEKIAEAFFNAIKQSLETTPAAPPSAAVRRPVPQR